MENGKESNLISEMESWGNVIDMSRYFLRVAAPHETPLLNWIFNSVGHDFLGRAEPRLRTDVFFMTE